MKPLSRLLLALFVLLPLALAAALFSESGSRALLELVDRYSPVQLDYAGGTVAGQLRLRRLALTTDGLVLEVTDLSAQLAPDCLWRSALCFSELQASGLDIALSAGDASESSRASDAETATDNEMLVFPVQIEADALSLDALRIRWPGGEWTQGPARLGLRLRESTVEISDAVLTRPTLHLHDTGEPPPAQTDRIDLGRIDLPLELSVQALRLEEPGWNTYGSEHRLQHLALRGHWRRTRLQLQQLDGTDSEWGELSLGGNIDLTGDWPLRLDSTIELARPPLWQGLHGRDLTLALEGSLAALQVELDSTGAPGLTAQARLDVLDRQFPFDGSAQLHWPDGTTLGDIAAVPPALTQVMLESPVEVSVQGALAAQQFELRGVASGLGYESMALHAAGSQEQGRVTLSELLLRDGTGDNQLAGTGELLLGESTQASLALRSGGFDLPRVSEYARGRLQGGLRLTATVSGEKWQIDAAEVDIGGDINGLPATISGHGGVRHGPRLTPSDLRADINGARLLLRTPDVTAQSGQLDLVIEDLGRWQPGTRGQARLQGQLTADGQDIQLTGNMQDIQWQGLLIGGGTFSGSYHAANQAFVLDSNWQDVQLADINLSSVQVLADGTPGRHSLSLLSRGELQGNLGLTGSFREEQWRGSLGATTLQTPHGSWQLPHAVPMSWSADAGQFTLAAHCWRQSRTRICPGELRWAEQGSGSLEIDGDLDFLAGLMPEGVELQGALQLRLQGGWSPAAGVSVDGESRTRSVQLTRDFGEGETARFGWDSSDVTITYNAQGLRLDGQVQQDTRKVLGMNILLPPKREGPLSGTLQFNELQLGAMAPFAPMLTRLRGNLGGELKLEGTVDRPLARGEIRLADGELALAGNPTRLENLDLLLDMQGDRAAVRGSGILGGGEMRLEGAIISDPQWRLALSVTGDKHAILYPPSAQLLVSQALDISATSGLLDVRGELTVLEGSLQPDDLPEGSVALSADVVEVDYAGNVIREEFPFDVSMSVRVRVEDRFRVTGSLIDATLGGNLDLSQQPGRPLQVFGKLNVLGGELRAYQRRLTIKRGTLSFSGRPDNPELNLRAQRAIRSSNVIAGVQVQGTFDALVLNVYSEPPMPQDEAMSYLVRGRGLDSSTGADGTALALSLASGGVNRSTLVTELNRIPGVSNVAFGAQGEEDDTTATVSGYIDERIYLSYGVGLYEPINVLTARYYLRSRLWLEVVSSLENSMDLYYSFEIK